VTIDDRRPSGDICRGSIWFSPDGFEARFQSDDGRFIILPLPLARNSFTLEDKTVEHI
jgi:hypothetical protein